MLNGIFAAVSALRVHTQRVGQSAHNLANASTTAFQPQRLDLAEQSSGGVAVAGKTTLPAGPLVSTGGTLDLAIDGPGFFSLADGQRGEVYTRSGSFMLSNNGQLVDSSGRALLPGVQVPPNAAQIHVSPDGVVSALGADGAILAQGEIQTASFANSGGLSPLGDNLFAATPASGPVVHDAPGQAGHGSLVSGALQASGTDIATEMISLITSQRAFEANVKTVQTYDEMLGSVLDIKS